MDTTQNRPDFGSGSRSAGPIVDKGLMAPTPSLHPACIRAIKGFDDTTAGYVAPAMEAFETAHAGTQSIIDARAKVMLNDAWSPERKLLELAGLAEKQQLRATKSFDAARTRLIQGRTALEESLSKPLTQDANAGTINSEIRVHMKSLKTEDRHKLLDEATKAQDATTLRAVLSAPSYLTGISEDERALRISMYNRMTQPAIAQRVDVMRKAVELIENRGPMILTQVEAALGGKGSWHKIAAARTRQRAAEDAVRVA
jgi:hypothetical protein